MKLLLSNGMFARMAKQPPAAHMHQWELEARLLYSLMVAGKSANFVDRCLGEFLRMVAKDEAVAAVALKLTPFRMLKAIRPARVATLLRLARTGNYTKLGKAIAELLAAGLDLNTCTPAQLEAIHGIGPKTARFFIIWTRPQEEYAALDVHVLRWLRAQGVDAPESTPQSPAKYRRLEEAFIRIAKRRGLTPRQLDEKIWAAGAGRTQASAVP